MSEFMITEGDRSGVFTPSPREKAVAMLGVASAHLTRALNCLTHGDIHGNIEEKALFNIDESIKALKTAQRQLNRE